jgi:predicted nuclease of predicted toxin-antitoxin system
MRFLLDANLSPKLVQRLRDAGHDARHVGDLGLLTATDDEIFDRAAAEGWIVITADTDFSMLLALRAAGRPSVVLLRHVAELRPAAHGDLILANLDAVSADLAHGAIVSLSQTRLSVRTLPLESTDRGDA